MDGLECSERLFSQLERTNRLDSEFYKKKSLSIVELLRGINAAPLTNYVEVSDGNHMGISDKFIEEGIPYYRGQDIHNFFIEDAHPIYIDEDTYNSSYMHRSHLKKNDILLSIVGTIGEVSLVSKDEKATCNCKLAILRPHDEKRSALIAIYLKTKYGFDQVDKFKRGAVQMGYLLEDMNQILIPDFSPDMGDVIARAIDGVKALTDRSNQQYASAEKCLLDAIGIDMSTITNGGVSVKSFAESFGTSGRLDAEYYQPKYDKFEKHILHYTNGYTTPSDEFELIKAKCDRNLAEYPYVEIGDIDIGSGAYEYNIISTDELPANAKIMTQKGDLLVSTVRPYRGAVSILNEDKLLVSGAFTVLREKGTYPAQTLQVLFRTSLYKDWLLKYNVGTSYPVIKDDDVLNIPIPVLDDSVHLAIREKVKQSQNLLSSAKELLDYAKQAVEMAIEQDEAIAITWLDGMIAELTNE
jgi:restriction endonuclease S subunit